MNRKISKAAAAAFVAGKKFKQGNTEVAFLQGNPVLYLHSNPIARRLPSGRIETTFAGWQTPTTKGRINAVLAAANIPAHYSVRKGDLYLYRDGMEYPACPHVWQGFNA